MKKKKLIQSTKGQTQTSEGLELILETMKNPNIFKDILLYILFIFIGILFYLHAFIPTDSKELIALKKEHIKAKQKRTKALDKIKEYSKNTAIYQEYLVEKENARLTWDRLKEEAENQKVFAFKSIQPFIERFGLILCIFVYALFNLVRSFYREPKVVFTKITHSFILSICFFHFYWIFQTFQDVSKPSYILITLFSALFIYLAVYIITKRKKLYVDEIKDDMILIAQKALENSRPEKKEEMINLLEKIAKKNK